MSASSDWKRSLKLFFSERAQEVEATPTHEDLCYISGREPRLWSQMDVYGDMIRSIVALIGANTASNVLEVGCAAGFIAKGIAPHVGRYTGIDLVNQPLAVARRLGLANAVFVRSAGERLGFGDGEFDAAFCYDVFTNFPKFADGTGLIREMLRVVRPGGKVLIGSIPDAATQLMFEARVKKVLQDLEQRFGPLKPRPPTARQKVVPWYRAFMGHVAGWWRKVQPEIVCYYFRAEDFQVLGRELGANSEQYDLHPLNPYAGYRFNIVYTRSQT